MGGHPCMCTFILSILIYQWQWGLCGYPVSSSLIPPIAVGCHDIQDYNFSQKKSLVWFVVNGIGTILMTQGLNDHKKQQRPISHSFLATIAVNVERYSF